MKRKQQLLSFPVLKKAKPTTSTQNKPTVKYQTKWMQSLPDVNAAIPDIYDKIRWHKVSYFKPALKKQLVTPRYTTVFGCDEDPNSQNKRVFPIEPIPQFLVPVLKAVEEYTGQHFNMIMCNLYLEANHSISYHSDDENFLGPNPCIASLTIGGSRDFYLREKADKKNIIKYELKHGDMIVMEGSTQHDWEHAVPKRSSIEEPRINLTFRRVVDYRGTNNYYKYTKFGDTDPNEANIWKYDKKSRKVTPMERN